MTTFRSNGQAIFPHARIGAAMSARKRCFKCGEVKSIDAFYVHPGAVDRHRGKCKECTKQDGRETRAAHRARCRESERARNQRAERKAALLARNRRRYVEHPEQKRAHVMVARAVRSGRLTRLPCEQCGDVKVQGHHPDYSKPLEVQWLCIRHHKEAHGQGVPR